MNQSQAEVADKLLLSARQSSLKCTAIVRMKAIKFLNNDQYARDLDRKNIERIKRIFDTEGCFRLDRSNSIPVLADEDVFRQTINKAGLGPGVGPYLNLDFGDDELLCLHGRHRLLAAYEYLPPMDQFWVVDIFVDPNEQLKSHVVRDFTNSLNISDGEIWRHIRMCTKLGDDSGEREWWSRLTKGKDQDLHQLIRHPQFCQAFDKLLVFPGLWTGLQLGSLHRFLSLKCDEEIIHYLHHIYLVWSGIFAGCIDFQTFTDSDSVRRLQLRAPNSSRKDFQEITENMEKGELFPSIQDVRIRGLILHNIRATKRIIPSLFTFFEDLKYLEPLANSMKKLIGPMKRSTKTSVYREFQQVFTVPATRPAGSCDEVVELQLSEGEFGSCYGSLREKMEFGYRQLWIYAMRHFPDLVSLPPLKENGQPKPIIKEVDPGTLIRFADLAYRFGFDSPAIQKIRSENPDYQIALAFLQRTKPAELYIYDQSTLELNAKYISRILAAFEKRGGEPQNLQGTTGQHLSKDRFVRRCGRPFEFDYLRDKNNLFIPQINENRAGGQDNDISSFFVRVSFYLAFFGSDNFELMNAQNSEMDLQLPSPQLPPVSNSTATAQADLETQVPPPLAVAAQANPDNPVLPPPLATVAVEANPNTEALSPSSIASSEQYNVWEDGDISMEDLLGSPSASNPRQKLTRTSLKGAVMRVSLKPNITSNVNNVRLKVSRTGTTKTIFDARFKYSDSQSKKFFIGQNQLRELMVEAAKQQFTVKDGNGQIMALQKVEETLTSGRTGVVTLQK